MTTSDAESALGAIAAAIVPPAQEIAERVRARLDADRELAEVAVRLAAAQHTPRPRLIQRRVVVCAADHGLALRRPVHIDPGLGVVTATGAPTRAALAQLADGGAAVNAAAHAAEAPLVLVDCGVGTGPALRGVLDVRIGDGTADIRHEAAMTTDRAAASVHTGMALLFSLAEPGLDVVALGQLALGARAVSGAVVAALTDDRALDDAVDPTDRADVAAALARHSPDGPLEVLAALGGFDLGVMAGVVLAAASIRVPVVLDDHGTAAAALLAARWQPAVSGYLFAAHAGSTATHRAALRALALTPLYPQAISHGEGAGAALALPLLDQAARLAGDASH